MVQRLPEKTSAGKIKRKRRDLERVLRKPGLAASKKVEIERAIKALEQDLIDAEKNNQMRKMAKKYHMVKFFEKKKAIRSLKKPTATDAELADYFYVVNYPLDQKYDGLYAAEAKGRESEFYKKIIQDMKNGRLPSGPEGIQKTLAELFPNKHMNKRRLEESEDDDDNEQTASDESETHYEHENRDRTAGVQDHDSKKRKLNDPKNTTSDQENDVSNEPTESSEGANSVENDSSDETD